MKAIWMKIMKEKMKSIFPMHCLFTSNEGDVKMTSLMSYRTTIMRILRSKIIHRKVNINSISIRKGNVEYTMAQCRHQKYI